MRPCAWPIIIAYFVGLLTLPLAALLTMFVEYMAKKRVERIKGDGG